MMSVQCPNCGAPTIELFTSRVCSAECDNKAKADGCYYFGCSDGGEPRNAWLFNSESSVRTAWEGCSFDYKLYRYRGPVDDTTGPMYKLAAKRDKGFVGFGVSDGVVEPL